MVRIARKGSNAAERVAEEEKVEDPEFRLVDGLGAEEIDARLRRTCRVADLGNRATAFYLADLHQRGLHQSLGYPTTIAYAERALGLSRRKARELLHAGLRLKELPTIDEAFAGNRICWSRVRRLCNVATPQTEGAWLERAQEVSQDELERLTMRMRPGEVPPEGTGLPHARFTLRFELDAARWQMWENARSKLRAESGDEAGIRDIDIFDEMLRLVLASDAEGTVPGRKAVEGGPYRVTLRNEKIVGQDGEEPLDPAKAEGIASNAETPPALRTKVLSRDGHACVHCKGRRGLHAHHVQWRSRGGLTQLNNLVTLCVRCHGLVHEGFLEVAIERERRNGKRPSFVFRHASGRQLDGRNVASEVTGAQRATPPSTRSVTAKKRLSPPSSAATDRSGARARDRAESSAP